MIDLDLEAIEKDFCGLYEPWASKFSAMIAEVRRLRREELAGQKATHLCLPKHSADERPVPAGTWLYKYRITYGPRKGEICFAIDYHQEEANFFEAEIYGHAEVLEYYGLLPENGELP